MDQDPYLACETASATTSNSMLTLSNYYATQDTDHGGWTEISQQRRHLDRLLNLSSSDDYSSGHDNYSQGYHSLEGHM